MLNDVGLIIILANGKTGKEIDKKEVKSDEKGEF